MGAYLLDQYSLLHFATGIITYFWGISAKTLLLIHTLFELSENTQTGMSFINNLSFWPGGKPKSDTLLNIIGDTLAVLFGWFCAYQLDKIANELGWYQAHLQ